jgi:hypothetical protein
MTRNHITVPTTLRGTLFQLLRSAAIEMSFPAGNAGFIYEVDWCNVESRLSLPNGTVKKLGELLPECGMGSKKHIAREGCQLCRRGGRVIGSSRRSYKPVEVSQQ